MRKLKSKQKLLASILAVSVALSSTATSLSVITASAGFNGNGAVLPK